MGDFEDPDRLGPLKYYPPTRDRLRTMSQDEVGSKTSPLERCYKLRAIMAPSDDVPYGRSTYAVSKEADVHLKVLLDFLSTGGSPQNYREEEQTYNRDHLNRLARWIDATDAPPSAGLGVIREAVVETDGSSDRSASSSRSVSRSVSRANSGRQLTGGATTGSSSKKQQQQQQQREPSVLDEFLESVDSRLVSTGVGHRLVALGVTRPGQVHDLSLRQLTHEAGVKKLLARRLKNAEAVHFDAERMRRGQSPFTGRNEAGVGVDDDEDEEECGEGDDNEEEEKREQDLEELLQQAAALGMQGPELERAREAILKKKAEKLEALEQEDDQTPPHSVERFLEELSPHFAHYGPTLQRIGVRRPGELASMSIDRLTAAGVKKLHARRMVSAEAAHLDAEQMVASATRAAVGGGNGDGDGGRGRGRDGSSSSSSSSSSNSNRSSKARDDEEIRKQLQALLLEADRAGIGMTPEVDAAKRTIAKAKAREISREMVPQ